MLISEVIEEFKQVQLNFDKEKDIEALNRCILGYQNLLSEIPGDPEILFQLGTAHLQLGQFGLAAVFFNQVIESWPDNAHIWSNLGCCYRSMHMLPEARNCFEKSLMYEQRAETYSNLASSYVNEDCPEKGIPYAEKAIELSGDIAQPKWNAALLYLEMQNWAKGFLYYEAGFFCGERLLRSYSNDPESIPFWTGPCA